MNRSSSTPPSSRHSSAYWRRRCRRRADRRDVVGEQPLQQRERLRAASFRSRPCARRRRPRTARAPPRARAHAAAGVLDRHLPAGELHQLRAGREVALVQRRASQCAASAAEGPIRAAGRRRHGAPAPETRAAAAGDSNEDAATVLGSASGDSRRAALAQERRDVDVVVGDLERGALAIVDARAAVGAARRGCRGARRCAPGRWSKPVPITVTRTSSPMPSSITAPKMMFAFGSAAFWMISAASLTSNRPRSLPPVMLSRMPVAPSTDSSSSGEEIAALAASAQRFSPPAVPMPISAEPASLHDRAHVGEVEVDQAGDRDQVGDPLHALAQHVVGLAERVEHRGAPLDDRQQLLVRDHDQRVDDLAQALDALGSPGGRAGRPRSRTAASRRRRSARRSRSWRSRRSPARRRCRCRRPRRRSRTPCPRP